MESRKLKNFQAVAMIFAAIAVPVIVAVVGWKVQSSIATQGVRKDYVQIAVGILSQPAVEDEARLRAWAVAVLDENSPVPFGPSLRKELLNGTISPDGKFIAPRFVQILERTEMMKFKPTPWMMVEKDASGLIATDDLLKNYLANMRVANESRITLEALQDAIRKTAAYEKEALGPLPQTE